MQRLIGFPFAQTLFPDPGYNRPGRKGQCSAVPFKRHTKKAPPKQVIYTPLPATNFAHPKTPSRALLVSSPAEPPSAVRDATTRTPARRCPYAAPRSPVSGVTARGGTWGYPRLSNARVGLLRSS
jgi:hypothetical protein